MLKSLALENWKSHQSTQLDFEAGPNVLVGIMGSGKTSVVEAISFALFGTFPSLQSKKVSLDDLIASGQPAGRAQVRFAANGKEYIVSRDIRRGKGSGAEVRQGNDVLDVNPRSVTETVSKVLGMDYDIFSRAVYSEQNGIDYFLRIPRGQRMGHIDRMLKLDRYEKAREGCVALKNRVRASASGLMKVIADLEKESPERMLAESELRAKELSEEVAKLEIEASSAGKKVADISAKLKAAEASRKAADDARRRAEVLNARLSEWNSSLAALEVKVADAPDVDALRKSAEDTRKRLESAKSKERELREKAAEASASLKSLKEKEIPELQARHAEVETAEALMKKLDAQFPDVDSSINATKERMAALQSELGSLDSRAGEIRRYLGVIEGGQCPACGQSVSEDARAALERERKEELAAVASSIAERKMELGKAKASLGEMEDAASRRSVLDERLRGRDSVVQKLLEVERAVKANVENGRSLARELAKASESLASSEAADRTAASDLQRAESVLSDIKTAGELRERISNAMDAVSIATKEAAEMERLSSGLESIREEMTSAASTYASLSSRLAGSRDMLEERRRSARDIGRSVETLRRYRDEAQSWEDSMVMLGSLESVLDATQNELREEFVKSVNGIMNAVWADIYPYGDFTEVRLGIDGDYVLQLKRGGEWLQADGVASGGERSLACLALRIAFSLAFMPNLRWLILDEPTHNLDANAVEKLAEVLRDRSHLFAEQVFVITHDERLAEGLRSIRLERDKAAGSPTRLAA